MIYSYWTCFYDNISFHSLSNALPEIFFKVLMVSWELWDMVLSMEVHERKKMALII